MKACVFCKGRVAPRKGQLTQFHGPPKTTWSLTLGTISAMTLSSKQMCWKGNGGYPYPRMERQ